MAETQFYTPLNTLVNGYRLLAHVSGVSERTIRECDTERRYPYFAQGYLDLGLGRHLHVTNDIAAHIDGYALADANGVVQRAYSTMENAVAARDAVAPKLAPEPEVQPESHEAVAPLAAATV